METATQQEQHDDLLSIVRQRLTLKAPSDSSTDTRQGYVREFNRLDGEHGRSAHDIWNLARKTTSAGTYGRRVAALKYGIVKMLEDYLARANHQKPQRDDMDAIQEVLELDRLVSSAAKPYPANPKSRVRPGSQVMGRRSQRQNLRRFPDDWRNQLARKFIGMQYEKAYLISALSGLRPHELQRGIEVQWTSDEFTLSIWGAKVKGEIQGQPVRNIVYDVNHPFVARLLQLVELGEGAVALVSVPSKVAWTSALRRAGRTLWPNVKKDVVPYLLRHALISDMKRAGGDPDEISAALGHRSARTKSRYGSWAAGGKNPLLPKRATAAKPIRHLDSKPSPINGR
ncbi:site-specific integrase [Achromobacter aloeverae]|uniref:Integrase n=1 Tax=Achromobacter aloeverae TaxID=1750518 RepID=A0A4Q1HIC8_9BURK|nr:site-specific integrase [Achromobacter aloeverae]RXN87807.1 hypothetical protein C7R54_14520 [Achromobacter aloeverae]